MSQHNIQASDVETVFQIIPGVQSYDWGKTAEQNSLVCQFAEATEQLGFQRERSKPYAEVSRIAANTHVS
jgi:mannose-6-phosphate isomerase